MSILFVSDIHLCNKKPKIIDGFLNFLNQHAIHSQALYILGDLFEKWLGDDDYNLLHFNVAKSLKSLQKKKIPCYFIHGNHDFLLGKKYADLCNMILLPTSQVLKMPSGKNIIILHGDTLFVQDKSYQKFRKFLRNYILQKLFLSLPLFMRLYIFDKIYSCCTQQKNKSKKQLKINSKIVIDMLIRNQSEIMIHGHTHKPAIHKIHHSKNIILKRVSLGGWGKYGSIAKINEKNNKINLIKFHFQ